MTRKDYIKLAAALKEAGDVAIGDDNYQQLAGVAVATRRIADALAADNDRFDRERFYRAAGLKN